jgi:hypothetical protein
LRTVELLVNEVDISPVFGGEAVKKRRRKVVQGETGTCTNRRCQHHVQHRSWERREGEDNSSSKIEA